MKCCLPPDLPETRQGIESSCVNGFELRGIDAPLIEGDLKSVDDRWQCIVDVSALVIANDATGPVHQRQVFLEIKYNAGLEFV